MAKGKFVSYLRVSTDKQGRSDLGVEAQREAVARYLNGGSWKLVAEYVETESGKRSDRPKLGAALGRAKAIGALYVTIRSIAWASPSLRWFQQGRPPPRLALVAD
jgi:DNA invertase Pin-like site-specific DNA recombinase